MQNINDKSAKILESSIGEEELGYDDNLHNIEDYMGKVKSSTIGETNTFKKLDEVFSPRCIANEYPTLSPRGIIDKFN